MNATAPPGSALPPAAPEPVWRAFARRGVRNLALCGVIALVLWAMAPAEWSGFLVNLVYSVTIGTLCWFFIDGARLLLAHALYRRSLDPWKRQSRWPGAPWMVACILAGTALGYTLGAAIGDALTGYRIPSLLHNRSAVLISLIAGIAATAYFYANERLHAERTAAETARRVAAETQLRLLQSQLEPHMLFNTLANLRVLIGVDAARAQAMLDHLIAYLRATLQASRTGSHPLADEFDRLADYLALMAVRMGPRLRVEFDLPDALRTLPVPPLLLQPLVENAIRHGLEPRIDGGVLRVSARAEGDSLVLAVRDTGVGMARRDDGADTAYGLAHVRERLAVLFGSNAQFTLAPVADGGTCAEIRLPLSAPAATAGAAS